MKRNYTYYPTNKDCLYYLEFISEDSKSTPEIWTLFKRNFVNDSQSEVHPYNLGNGNVHPEHYHTMFTKQYLKFIVDAMNLAVAKSEAAV